MKVASTRAWRKLLCRLACFASHHRSRGICFSGATVWYHDSFDDHVVFAHSCGAVRGCQMLQSMLSKCYQMLQNMLSDVAGHAVDMLSLVISCLECCQMWYHGSPDVHVVYAHSFGAVRCFDVLQSMLSRCCRGLSVVQDVVRCRMVSRCFQMLQSMFSTCCQMLRSMS